MKKKIEKKKKEKKINSWPRKASQGVGGREEKKKGQREWRKREREREWVMGEFVFVSPVNIMDDLTRLRKAPSPRLISVSRATSHGTARGCLHRRCIHPPCVTHQKPRTLYVIHDH